MRQRILFMATTSDLQALMTAIETRKSLKYTLCGFPDEPILHQWSSFAQIENFGVIQSENSAFHEYFMISEPSLEIKIEPVPQNKGGIKYYINTPLNPKTVRLKPGGLFQNEVVVAAEFLKYSVEPEAKQIFGLFEREIKKRFKKCKDYPYWLGQEALEFHRLGKRLTDDVRSPFSLPSETVIKS